MIDPRKIWSSKQLPTLPTVAISLLEISKNPEAEIKEVVEVIRQDPAITAKILKSTNSSFFGFKSQVTSIDRAVPLLGTTVVTSLALSFSLVDAAMTSGPMVEHYSSYWKQSVVQAASAEMLSEFGADGLACEYFLTGLLIDLGRLAMLKTIPQEYLPVLTASIEQQRDLQDVEREKLGFDHVEIGLKLMESWGLPDSLRQAVALHHAPLASLQAEAASPQFDLVKSGAVAAAIGSYFCTTNIGPALERLRALTSDFYSLDDTSLMAFLDRVKARIEEAGEMLSANMSDLGDPSDLMAQANEHLAQLAMREHAAGAQAAARHEAVEKEKQELELRNEQLKKQALHDPLTKIYNRHFFDDALAKELNRCGRTASTIGLIFTDIDRFKNLNDTYGHPFGDQVLQQVAAAFCDVVRKSDVLARYGGEEFVMIVVQPTEKGLEKVAERVRSRVEALEIYFEGKRVPVTVSVGAAIAIPPRNDEGLAAKLIASADEAMYESKQNGRNQVHLRNLLGNSERQLATLVAARRFSRWLVNRNELDIPTISRVLLQCDTPHIRIGVLAQQQGLLDAAEVDRILQDQEATQDRFGEAAVRLGLLTQEKLAQLLALQQEDPILLGKVLVAQGVLDRARAAQLIKEFLASNGQSLPSAQLQPA